MRDRDKPFVMYRRGPASFTIVPRGVAGWCQFAVWMALLGALVIWFVGHSKASGSSADVSDGFLLFVIGVFLWVVAGLWWMIARAEIIDVAELIRDRQRQRRKRQREQ